MDNILTKHIKPFKIKIDTFGVYSGDKNPSKYTSKDEYILFLQLGETK